MKAGYEKGEPEPVSSPPYLSKSSSVGLIERQCEHKSMMGAAENHGQGWQTAQPSELFGGIGGGYEWTNRIGLVGHRVNHSTRPGRSDGSASLPSTEATTGLQFGWLSSSAAFVS